MPTFDIDLTTADVLPDGSYTATVKGVDCKPSKAGDNTLINWTLQINSPEKYAGRVVFNNTNFKVPFKIKQMMDACKCTYDTTGFDPDITVGKQLMVQVGTREDSDFGIQNTVVKVWAV